MRAHRFDKSLFRHTPEYFELESTNLGLLPATCRNFIDQASNDQTTYQGQFTIDQKKRLKTVSLA